MERLIFHVDVNSAFLSWEAARRVQNGEADLRLIPSCVGGDPETRRGIVLAKSIPAKRYQVKTGEPLSLALRKCPSLVIVPPDFRLYSRCSKAFKEICRRWAPVVEEFSIDECFLDMTGTALLYPDPVAAAHELKNEIRDTLGFTVNVGIGRSKLCAKMASDFEKPDRVHTLFPEEIPEKMWKLPVGELLFVGGSTAARLERAYIRTVGDLARADPVTLKRLLGERTALQAQRYARGEDDSPVRAQRDPPKSYSNAVTLEDNVETPEKAHEILLTLADSVSAHMRSHGDLCFGVGVTIRYLDFKNRTHQCKLREATDSTNEIYETAKKLLASMWQDRRPLRLLSVTLFDLTKEDGAQLSLFREEAAGRERGRRLDQTVDALRGKFGADAIRRGATLQSNVEVARKFKGKQAAETEKE